MHDSAKYLIHADLEASGVVERSDVVGAIFGQTEGLLGDELDIRDLQESGRLGRIEVEVDSEGGRSFGTITIASGLDRVETAILAAALESIERVGPCRADVEVSSLEDVRSAKRREIVDRATDLFAEFDESSLTGRDIVEEVRKAVRVEDVTEFHGLPAGPRVADSDAVVVVEGRSDVLALLEYGVKNAIAVEGTDVPDPVAELTRERTVTAFLDGDRGGDLILKELAQVGNIDYVALAPPGRSVEDLSRREALSALRGKVPFEAVEGSQEPTASDASALEVTAEEQSTDGAGGRETGPTADDAGGPDDRPMDGDGAVGEVDGDSRAEDATASGDGAVDVKPTDRVAGNVASGEPIEEPGTAVAGDGAGSDATTADAADTDGPATESPGTGGETTAATESTGESSPQTLAGHVEAVVDGETGLARALDANRDVVDEQSADEAFDLLESLEAAPEALVLDGELSQRVLDVAAQRGVDQVVCATEGEYVKQPTDVRVRTAAEL